jgi:uncharacterized membrane protein YbhN (UPF0104 family)
MDPAPPFEWPFSDRGRDPVLERFQDLSLSRALSPLLHWHAGHLAVLFIVNAAIIWAMSLRWQLILRRSGYHIGIQVLAAYRMGANAISYLTPGPQFGGEPFQVGMLIHRHKTVAQDAAASVAADRLIELCINCIVLLVGLIFLLQARLLAATASIDTIAGITLLILLTGSILLALAIGKTPLSYWLDAICKRFGNRSGLACASTWLQTAERRTGEMLRQPPRVLMLYIGALAGPMGIHDRRILADLFCLWIAVVARPINRRRSGGPAGFPAAPAGGWALWKAARC